MKITVCDLNGRSKILKLGDYFYASKMHEDNINLYVYKRIIITPSGIIYNVFMDMKTKEEVICQHGYTHIVFKDIVTNTDNIYITYVKKNDLSEVKDCKLSDIKLEGKDNVNNIYILDEVMQIR